MKGYRIANWDRLYETSETRKVKRLQWVPTQNKHDGLGYRRMVSQPDACELFAAWNIILQVASKGEGNERGTLVRDGVPLHPDDFLMISGFPSRIFEKALQFFATKELGWLELYEISGNKSDVSGSHPVEEKEWKEENGKKEEAPAVVVSPFFSIPESMKELRTPRFTKLMGEFIEHRRQIKKPMTALSIDKTLLRLHRMGEAAACDAIEESIANGWRGVFEPRGNGGNGARRGPTSPPDSSRASIRELTGK